MEAAIAAAVDGAAAAAVDDAAGGADVDSAAASGGAPPGVTTRGRSATIRPGGSQRLRAGYQGLADFAEDSRFSSAAGAADSVSGSHATGEGAGPAERSSVKYATMLPYGAAEPSAVVRQRREKQERRRRLQQLQSARVPSAQQVYAALKHMICSQHYRPPIPLDTPELVRAAIQAGWDPEPARRPSAQELLDALSSAELTRSLSVYPVPGPAPPATPARTPMAGYAGGFRR